MQLISTILISLFLGFGPQPVDAPVKRVPDVNVKTLDGKSISITEAIGEGKITVLSFWATWCAPCKKELDAIAEVYEDWQAEYDMQLIAVTIDNARALAKVKPMVERKGWEYMILSDAKQDLQRAMSFQTIPQTYLLNQEGEIVYEHSGYAPGDEFELEEYIKKCVK